MYISLDCLDPNAVFPSDKYGKPCRNENCLFYIDVNPQDQKFETLNVARPVWCKISAQTIQRMQLSFRYMESGRVVRTLGMGEEFQVGLIEKKRLAIEL
ncbi:MAG: hypothetical protein GY820_21530 [Gammaproteobacteria bacterium]|nr:hypothetical protein [Gammaproteobacteria bacterium]